MSHAVETLRTIAVPACPLCGQPGAPLHSGVPDHFFGIHGRWNLRHCTAAGCRLIWQDPRVIDADLLLAYESYSTRGASEPTPLANKRGPSAGFLRLDRWCARLLGMTEERELLSTAYLRDVSPGRLLDVGCGNGNFAYGMQQRGWTVRGTDFDPVAAQRVRCTFDFPVDIGDLASIRFDAASFDAVTARHVIEHVPRPVEFIAECLRILKPGGRLVVVTPNTAGLGHRHYGPYWRGLEQPRHLHLFDPVSMMMMLAKAGAPGADVFSTSQGAAYAYHSSSVAWGRSVPPWRKPVAAAMVWVLQVKSVLLIRYRGQPVGEDLVAIAPKA